MYLVLSRKRNEIIDIGDDIEIMVISIWGNKVRLGISAPEHVTINRREVTEAIAQEEAEINELRRG